MLIGRIFFRCFTNLRSQTESVAMKSDEPYGEAALMLCESLLHLFVDEGLIAKEKALEALEGVAELAGERPENDARAESKPSLASLVEAIATSFKLKD
jgi:hypothetical protein